MKKERYIETGREMVRELLKHKDHKTETEMRHRRRKKWRYSETDREMVKKR